MAYPASLMKVETVTQTGQLARPSQRAVAFLIFLGHNHVKVKAGILGYLPNKGFSLGGGGRRRHAIHIEGRVAAKTAVRSIRPQRHLRAHRRFGARSESRSRQIGHAVVCRHLRDMPPKPAWSGQGPFPCHALHVLAGPLLNQCRHGLGADFLSRVPRHSAKPGAGNRGEIVAALLCASAGIVHAI